MNVVRSVSPLVPLRKQIVFAVPPSSNNGGVGSAAVRC
jgi:hypothetical protein